MKRRYRQPTSSHDGTYVYRRKGLPDEIPHRRLFRGVVIVRTEDAGRVAALLAVRGRRCTRGNVVLTREGQAESRA